MGGYGRGELSPYSDVDLLLVTQERGGDVSNATKKVLYPLWDAGFQVGHAALTATQALERTRRDLHSATAVLTARFVAGRMELFDELVDRRNRWLHRDRNALVRRIGESTAQRHRSLPRAGWSLAPDLKEDVGGLRDIHALAWLQVVTGAELVVPELGAANGLLLAVREALHAELRRKNDRIHIELQPLIAQRLALAGPDAADELMTQVHSAARTVEHLGGLLRAGATEATARLPRRSGSVQVLGRGVRIEDGWLTADATAADPVAALELVAAKAATGRPLSRRATTWLATAFAGDGPTRWDGALRSAFFRILGGGHAAEGLEMLDHAGAWPALMPEWTRVRGRAQHDPYHRYTVDGHSFVTVQELTRVLARDPVVGADPHALEPLHVLQLAALLHDVGKGSGEDHSVAGQRIARAVCLRMGLSAEETQEVADLVRWHLLLADTATRRDVDDGAVIAEVAQTVGNARALRGLYALTIADARATGTEAWSDWKASLVLTLYRKVLVALETGEIPMRSDVALHVQQIESYEPSLAGRAGEVLATLPPSYLESASLPDVVDEIRLLLRAPQAGEVRYRIDEAAEAGQAALTLCVSDRPGTLARTAGVLALNRISVLQAQAFSTTAGLALERFVVARGNGRSWDEVIADLEAAYSGRLALEAHLERKARDYRPPIDVVPEVRVLANVSSHSTVIEVRAPDALGLLYSVAAALNDLDLDIHIAKIDTLGRRVVDVFYVRTAWGTKLNEEQAAAVDAAIAHRVRRLFHD